MTSKWMPLLTERVNEWALRSHNLMAYMHFVGFEVLQSSDYENYFL
jgi:hypothetical protein